MNGFRLKRQGYSTYIKAGKARLQSWPMGRQQCECDRMFLSTTLIRTYICIGNIHIIELGASCSQSQARMPMHVVGSGADSTGVGPAKKRMRLHSNSYQVPVQFAPSTLPLTRDEPLLPQRPLCISLPVMASACPPIHTHMNAHQLQRHQPSPLWHARVSNKLPIAAGGNFPLALSLPSSTA